MSTDNTIPASAQPTPSPQPAAAQPTVPMPSPAESVHFLDYWQILYSRKEIVIAVSILLILVGIVITRRMPKVYAAQAVIEVHREIPNIDMAERPLRYDPYYLRTQFEIIKSDPIIEQVVREGNLQEELGMEYGWKATGTAKNTFERTVALVKSRTDLSIWRDTDLIAIQVRLDKPDKPEGEAAKVAARIANTIAEVYKNYVRDQSRQPIQLGIAQLETDLEAVNRQIDEEEERLRQLRERHGVTVVSQVDSGVDILRRQVLELTGKAEQARTDARIREKRYEHFSSLSFEDALASASSLVNDQSLANLLAKRQELETAMAAHTEAGLGPNHPDVVQARAALEDINRRLRENLNRIRTGFRIAWEQASAEADMYEESLRLKTSAERSVSGGVALEIERRQADLEALKARRSVIQTRIMSERFNLEMPKTAVRVIEQAKVPEVPAPVSPNFALNVTLSVVAGLFFGVVLAFFVEYLDTTVKTAEDVERYLQANVIGIVPQKLRSLNDPSSRFSHYEVYRVLRMNLKNSRALGNGKVVIFTSASAGEGKSLNAFNTAWVCAESGERVLLIDADLYHPRQHRTLGVSLTPGLSNVVVGEAQLDAAIVKTAQGNLDFLPAGRISSTSVFGLMDTDEMTHLMETAKSRYDRVIVDAPPMIGVSDTAQLVRLGDGVVQIVQHRKYPRAMCRRAKERIIAMGGNFLGVILNNVNAAHGSSSYYYENQYYYYYTSDAEGLVHRRRRRHGHDSSSDEHGSGREERKS